MNGPTGEDHASCLRVVRTSGGSLAWHVTCYDLVKSLLNDDRLGLAHPVPSLAARIENSPMVGPLYATAESEWAEHAAVRRSMQVFAAARSSSRWRPAIEFVVGDHVDEFLARGAPADFHADLSARLSVGVVTALLGVYQDRELLGELVWQAHRGEWDAAFRATDALHDYMRGQLSRRRTHPRDDLLTELAKAEAAAGGVSEPMENTASTILIAGSVTPTSVMDHGLILLLLHPEQRDMLFTEESAHRLLNEILRFRVFTPPAAPPSPNGLTRYANESFQLADAQIREGDLLLLDVRYADFDPAHFPDPQVFDGARPSPAHLAFGFGKRRCPGANIAYAELGTVFSVLFTRQPNLRLAGSWQEVCAEATRTGGEVQRLVVDW